MYGLRGDDIAHRLDTFPRGDMNLNTPGATTTIFFWFGAVSLWSLIFRYTGYEGQKGIMNEAKKMK